MPDAPGEPRPVSLPRPALLLALSLLFPMGTRTAEARPASDTTTAAAWARFSGDRVVASGASGQADRGTGRALTPADPVRIASISKLAVALTAMRLVKAGRLDLDADVSSYLGWRLRHPAFPDQPITLRSLLSHTAGLRDGIDYALPLDARLDAALADSRAWDGAHGPAAGYFAYANLNFPVIAAVLEGASGERFDRLASRLVFRPLRIDACFNWSGCPAGVMRRAVVLYRDDGEVARDDLRGRAPACPAVPARDGTCDLATYPLAHHGAAFSPQGGLRISPRGLARLGAVLAGRHPRFLPPALLHAMTAPVWRYDGTNGETEGGFHCAYGLGVMILALPGRPSSCQDDPFGDGVMRIGHAGEAYGLRSGLWVDPRTGRGVAFYATALPADAPRGTRSAFSAAEEAMIDRARRR